MNKEAVGKLAGEQILKDALWKAYCNGRANNVYIPEEVIPRLVLSLFPEKFEVLTSNQYDCSSCDSEDCSGCGETAYEAGCLDQADDCLRQLGEDK